MTPTLKEMHIHDLEDVRAALLDASDVFHRFRAKSDRIFRECENDDYEVERALNEEIHKICADLGSAEFWTLTVIRNLGGEE